RRADRVFSFEQSLFVFLQIFAVADRQPFHRRQPTREPPDHPPGLATYQLERVRILLLRHQAAPCRRGVRQVEEGEFLRCEKNHILGETAQVNHRQRTRVQEGGDEIAITGRIDAVGDDTAESEPCGEYL